MSDHSKDHDCGCHKDKDPCCNRERGLQGIRGVQGPQGRDGLEGAVGPMGPEGPQGSCVNCNGQPQPSNKCDMEFAQAFSIAEQVLNPSPGINLPGDAVKLENIQVSTAGIDVSQAASSGEFKVNKAGWYEVGAGMTGYLNPIPAPLPVWTLSVFKNNTIVLGSTFSNVPISPAQASNELTAETLIHLNAGDVLKIASTSTNPVFLSAPKLGTNAQTSSAYLKVVMIKCDSQGENPQVDAVNAAFNSALSAANLSFVAGTTVNLSQNPADAANAQTEANNVVASLTAANAALLAANAFATPASYAMAVANIASAQAQAANSLNAANAAVATLNPANTAALVAANGLSSSTASLLAAQPLVAL